MGATEKDTFMNRFLIIHGFIGSTSGFRTLRLRNNEASGGWRPSMAIVQSQSFPNNKNRLS